VLKLAPQHQTQRQAFHRKLSFHHHQPAIHHHLISDLLTPIRDHLLIPMDAFNLAHSAMIHTQLQEQMDYHCRVLEENRKIFFKVSNFFKINKFLF
jgi:hypothetical protein